MFGSYTLVCLTGLGRIYTCVCVCLSLSHTHTHTHTHEHTHNETHHEEFQRSRRVPMGPWWGRGANKDLSLSLLNSLSLSLSLSFSLCLYLSPSLSLSLTHTHTHTGPHSPWRVSEEQESSNSIQFYLLSLWEGEFPPFSPGQERNKETTSLMWGEVVGI